MPPKTPIVVRAVDDPADALRPFAWTTAIFFGVGFVGYLAWAFLTA